MNLPQDFLDLLAAFDRFSVRTLVIGGYAVGAHGRPRATKDLDVLLEPLSEDGREHCCKALEAFGALPSVVASLRTATTSDVVWFGTPPLRVDLLLGLPGFDFDNAWARRFEIDMGGAVVDVVGFDDLVAPKTAAGRPQDLADIRALTRER